MRAKYPFQPDVLDALPEQIAELFRGLEDQLLIEICSRLKIADQLNEVTVQNIRALRAHGITLEDIERAISDVAGVAQEKLDALMDEVVERNQQYYNGIADKMKITEPVVLVSQRDIDAIKRQSSDELLNLTQTMGFAIRKGGKVTQLTKPAEVLYTILNEAEVEIMSGAINYQTAIERAAKELVASGLKTVEYTNNGRKTIAQADVAARRAVMTGVNQLNSKYVEQAAEELGTELFEVSAHTGARNTGSGWQNHAAWQGKVYSTRSDDPDYKSIYEVCGLGQVDGLEGANCRHRRFPYFRGLSERSYTDAELSKIDPPPFEYQGKMYTRYQATQMQRKVERTVRKYKRQEVAAKAAGVTDQEVAAKAQLKRLRKLYRDFSDAAGLPTQEQRMKVLYPD